MNQQVQVTVQQSSVTRRRTGSLGCLGLLSIFCLMCFTIGELGVAWWLNASWFDRFAYWRAPLVHAEPATVDAGTAEVIMARWLSELPPDPVSPSSREPDPTRPVLLEHARVTGDNVPGTGVTVSDPGNGATVRVPAGAIRQPAKVSLTQVQSIPAAMMGHFAGPVYDIKIDNHEHYQFGSPIEVTLPYVKGLVPNDKVVLSVWEKGRWVALPSKVDPVKGVVTGTSPHASFFSVSDAAKLAQRIGFTPVAGKLLGVLGLVFAAAENDTTRAAAFAAYYGNSEEYETPEGNFKVHYYTYGPAKIPRDWEVLNDPMTPSDTGRAQLYVRRIGHWLEYSRQELHAEGFNLPPAKLIRYDCFVVPIGKGGVNLGESNLGGPLFISSRIKEIAEAENTDAEELMKATCTHELLHVAQGGHYGTLASELWYTVEPICESDAEYNAWRFWRKRGMDDSYHVRTYMLSTPGLLTISFDKAEEHERYSYSLWFQWMHHRFGEETAMKFIRVSHEGGDGRLASMDAAARQVLGSHGINGLGEAMMEFAADYYHRDLWSPTLVPSAINGQALPTTVLRYFDDGFGYGTGIKAKFATIARKTADGSVVRSTYQQVTRASVPHMTAAAVYISSDMLVQDRDQPKPKLVIEADGAAMTASLHLAVASGTMSDPFGQAPAKGSPGTIEPMSFNGSKGQSIIEGFAAKDRPNFVTVIVTNRSFDRDLGGLTIRRWLLEPPQYAQLEPQTEGHGKWLLKWPPAPLEDHQEVFAGYRIYRRALNTARDTSKELVKEVTASAANAEVVQTQLTGPDVGNYIYSIAVFDTRGNESEIRDADLTDPFIGTWSGEVTLVQGSFVTPIMAAIKKSSDEADTKRQSRIDAIADPGQQQRELQNWEQEKQLRGDLVRLLNDLLSGAEQAARLGVPMQFQVRHVDGKYMAHLSELVWGLVPLEPEMQAEFELKRAGKHTLRVPGMPAELQSIDLTLHRMDPQGKKPNVIREDNYVLETKGEAAQTVPIHCVIRWNFERESTQSSEPPRPAQ